MYKILFLNMPSISLVDYRPTIDMMNGVGHLIGSLKNVECRYLDLNAKLFSYKNETGDNKLLSTSDYNTLTNPKQIQDYKQSEIINSYLNLLVPYVLEQVKDINEYSMIAYSVEQKTGRYYLTLPAISFLYIFNKHLQDKLNKRLPSYVGGSGVQLLKKFLEFKPKYYDNIDIKSPGTFILTGENDSRLPSFIGVAITDKGKAKNEIVFKTIKSNDTSLIKLPENITDFLPNTNSLFGEEITGAFPEIKNQKPFNVGCYVFLRGCQFKCSFCTEFSRRPIGDVSIDSIIESLKRFKDDGINHVNFYNNNINPSLKFLEEFCNRLAQENLNIKWADSANLSIVNDDSFQMMAEVGCVRLWYGTETISDRLLKQNNKQMINKEKMINGLRLSHEAGIWNQCNFIVNFPNETEEEFLMLKDFLVNNWNDGIIDGFVVNWFELRAGSKYSNHPEQFGLKNVDRSNIAFFQSYSEENKTWDEIYKDGDRKQKDLYKSIGVPNANIYELADHLFFMLHDTYKGDKSKMQEVYRFIIKNNLVNEVINLSTQHLQELYLDLYKQNIS